MLSVLTAEEVQTWQARSNAVSALLALRAQASVEADRASLPRIDAILAELEPSTDAATAHWRRAVDAMLATDFRPCDGATLRRALKSPRTGPPPVDDAVVADMRTYARKVITATDAAINERAALRR